jgi:hypothetical protein
VYADKYYNPEDGLTYAEKKIEQIAEMHHSPYLRLQTIQNGTNGTGIARYPYVGRVRQRGQKT